MDEFKMKCSFSSQNAQAFHTTD
eukprot:COSAG06_NODE_66991_length_253_cov_0.655844_1_plen_22_part_01